MFKLLGLFLLYLHYDHNIQQDSVDDCQNYVNRVSYYYCCEVAETIDDFLTFVISMTTHHIIIDSRLVTFSELMTRGGILVNP